MKQRQNVGFDSHTHVIAGMLLPYPYPPSCAFLSLCVFLFLQMRKRAVTVRPMIGRRQSLVGSKNSKSQLQDPLQRKKAERRRNSIQMTGKMSQEAEMVIDLYDSDENR
jgi:hypothetical protein